MITTPVRRILQNADDEVIYVETDNSVYRLTFPRNVLHQSALHSG